MSRVGLIGAGIVGSGVIQLLQRRGSASNLSLARVAVRDLDKARPNIPPGIPIGSIDALLSDPQVDVVVEVMGGIEPARSAIATALESGKSVVTANKAVVAAHGDALRALARTRGVTFRYEAAVGGGLPIIEILRAGLVFDGVDRLIGILNGTCNFILSRGEEAGLSFEDALTEAQALGFAEADPTLDVSGRDTAQKLGILVGLLENASVDGDEISVEGIEAISPEDHAAARILGLRIKLLGLYRRGAPAGAAALPKTKSGGPAELRVAPTLVPAASAVGLTVNEYNVVEVECPNIGWQLHLGKGAGQMPTAAAVIYDLERLSSSAPEPEIEGPLSVAEAKTWRCPWVFRIPPSRGALSLPDVGRFMGEHELVMTELRRAPDPRIGTLIVTEPASAENAAAFADRLRSSGLVVRYFGIEPDA